MEKQHSTTQKGSINSYSGVYIRFTELPFLCLSIWSINWIHFLAIIPICITVSWMFISHRVISIRKLNSWESRASYGLKLYKRRDQLLLPMWHITPLITLIQCTTALGIILATISAFYTLLLPTVLGVTLATISRIWYFDRMTWIYEDLKDIHHYFEVWKE